MSAAYQEVFIDVRHGRPYVSRHMDEGDGSFSWESAMNEADIEQEAIAAVEAQGGSLMQDGHYQCPPELAAKAVWPTRAR